MLELPFFETEEMLVILLILRRYGTDYLDFYTHLSWLILFLGMLLLDSCDIELVDFLLG